jgi:hypothetical protein
MARPWHCYLYSGASGRYQYTGTTICDLSHVS